MKKLASALLITAMLTVTAGTASAHITVSPKTTKTGAYEKYTVRVPVEKDINTTQIRLEVPQGVKLSTVKPLPGWDFELEKDTEGRATAIVWKANAGGLKKGEFAEFDLVGANPKEVGSGSLTWKSTQTYADGTVVEWTGAADSKTPASVTTLTQGTSDHSHGGDEHAEPTAHDERPFTETTLPLLLSGGALLLALISLFRKKA